MTKILKIDGLDCPNCANKLELELKKIDGVKSLEINFLKGELKFSCKNEAKTIEKIKEITKKLEPDVVLEECLKNEDKCSCNNVKSKNKFKLNIFLFVFGTIFGVASFILKNYSTVAFYIFLTLSVLLIGYKTFYKAFNLLTKKIVNENLLVTISVIGAILIGKELEALMVIFLYTVGKYLENIAVLKSRKSIEKLTNFKPEFARIVYKNGLEKTCDPKKVKIGDIILVKPGERIALDGEVIEGSVNLNTQSLTGESLPVFIKEGDKVLSGATVLDGVVKLKVTNLYKDSCINKILTLIEQASEKKSKTETFVSKIARWYTLGVLICAVIVFAIVFLTLKDFNLALYRGLIFLVVSCPCAFAISVPLSYFSGLGRASKRGILIKGSSFIDMCSKINTIGFDKTGTITTGNFEVKKIEILNKKYNKDDILFLASLGEQYSLHPLAKSIVKKNIMPLCEVKNVKEIAGRGVRFEYNNANFFVGKKIDGISDNQSTVVYLYENEILIGKIYLEDSIKINVKNTIEKLKSMGIKVILLSGDREKIVKKVSSNISIDECYFNLLPEEKFNIIQNFCKLDKTTFAFVGDGLNDAPALNLSDVGFCMGINGNDASIEGSDIVIVDDDIKKIYDCIKISKFTRKIVLENIIGSFIIKLTFLILGSIGLTGMLSAVMADVGLTLVAILNSLRILKYKIKQ